MISMDIDRIERMRRAMEAERLDAIVVRLPENVLLLSGYWPMIGQCLLVFPRESAPRILLPECFAAEAEAELWGAAPQWFRFGVLDSPAVAEVTRQFLRECSREKGWRRIGYEADFPALAPSWQSGEILVPTENARAFYASSLEPAELCDVSAFIRRERMRKTARDAERLRVASEIACIGLEVFQRNVKPGVSGIELVAMVEAEIMRRGTGYRGARRVRAYAQVATGAEETSIAYRMHEIYTGRPLADGEIAVLELGVVADGYWSDRTRACVAGTPTYEQAHAFEVLRRAQEAAVSAIRPGVRAAEVDATARQIIVDAGYGDAFPHVTGHGLGFAYHESAPILAPGSRDVLEEGMLTSVEPGIYTRAMGGFRIEDDVLVTAAGYEVLGPFPKQLTN
jgi:Xaa-Pro dipeptidase